MIANAFCWRKVLCEDRSWHANTRNQIASSVNEAVTTLVNMLQLRILHLQKSNCLHTNVIQVACCCGLIPVNDHRFHVMFCSLFIHVTSHSYRSNPQVWARQNSCCAQFTYRCSMIGNVAQSPTSRLWVYELLMNVVDSAYDRYCQWPTYIQPMAQAHVNYKRKRL